MRLQTKLFLREQSQYSNCDKALPVYSALMRSQQEFQFSYLATLTFSQPVVDRIAIQEVNRKQRRFISRYFYRRKDYASSLKFMFFIEPHVLKYRDQEKFHVHFLMSEVLDVQDPKRDPQRFEDPYRTFFIERAVIKNAQKIKSIVSYNRCKITKAELKRISDQENLSDYLLKEIKRKPSDLLSMIDVQNSDLRFQFDEENE